MSLKMEGKQNTPSVIARLMGLDKQPLRQTPHIPQKVLSEEYLRKTSCIGVLGKRSLYVDRINRSTARKQEKHSNNSEVLGTDRGNIWSICDEKENPKAGGTEFSFSRKRVMPGNEMLCHSNRFVGLVKDQHARDQRRYPQLYLSADKFAKQNSHESHVESYCLSACRGDVSKKLKTITSDRTTLRSLKVGNRGQPAMGDLNNFLKKQLELRDKFSSSSARSVAQKRNSLQAHSSKDLHLPKIDGCYRSDIQVDGCHRDLFNPEKGIVNVKEPEMENSEHELRRYCLTDSSRVVRKTHQAEHEDIGSLRSRSRSRTKMEQSSLTLSKHLMKSSESTFDCTKVHQIPFPSSLIFGTEEEKKNFEPWKTKNLEEGEVYDAGASIKRLYPKFGNHCLKRSQGINSKLVDPSRINRIYGLKNTYSEKLSRPNLSVIASRSPSFQTRPDDSKTGSSLVLEQAEIETPTKLQAAVSMTEDCFEKGSPLASFEKQLDRSEHLQCSDNSQSNASSDLHCCSAETEHMSTISDALIRNLASKNWMAHNETATLYEDGSSEVAPDTFSEKDGSSDVHVDLTSKMSSCETNKGGWISSCQYDPDLAVILGDANQPTPDSVLEPPFKEDDSPVADLRGLAMKLQLLDSKSEETNSVCSVMAVSSDEDTEGPSCVLFQNSGRIWEMIRPEESRDYSYLVDVLDEADVSDGNLDSWYQRWHAEELAMNFSVFEVLEKKYGKQASWQKSERRLLFDRINSLLTAILHSFSYFNIGAEPLRRFRSRLRRAEIEDELWSSLLVQGKEISKDLGEKALAKDMKWLELEEDIVFICTEIEQLLFHELVAELVRERL